MKEFKAQEGYVWKEKSTGKLLGSVVIPGKSLADKFLELYEQVKEIKDKE